MNIQKFLCIGATFMVISGCQNELISVYEVPKEVYKTIDTIGINKTNSTWKVPAHWVPLEKTSFRVAAWKISCSSHGDASSTRMTIIKLPGDSGGVLANVNRWRQQINLPFLSLEELLPMVKELSIDSNSFKWIQINPNDKGPQILVAFIKTNQNETWYFKLSGDHSHVIVEKDAFLNLLSHANV